MPESVPGDATPPESEDLLGRLHASLIKHQPDDPDMTDQLGDEVAYRD